MTLQIFTSSFVLSNVRSCFQHLEPRHMYVPPTNETCLGNALISLRPTLHRSSWRWLRCVVHPGAGPISVDATQEILGHAELTTSLRDRSGCPASIRPVAPFGRTSSSRRARARVKSTSGRHSRLSSTAKKAPSTTVRCCDGRGVITCPKGSCVDCTLRWPMAVVAAPVDLADTA